MTVENDNGRADGVVKLNVLDIPGPPRNLGFREVFSDRIVVEWDMPNDDGGSPITGYIIEKKEKARSKVRACVLYMLGSFIFDKLTLLSLFIVYNLITAISTSVRD